MSAETMNPSTDDFASMFEASFAGSNMQEGRVVPATVISVENDAVIVDVGLKTEGRVPLREFGQDGAPNAGDIVEVYLERIENALGEAVLSRDKARREEAWTRLEKLHEKEEPAEGAIVGRVKGGFTVDLLRLTSVQSKTSAHSWVLLSHSRSSKWTAHVVTSLYPAVQFSKRAALSNVQRSSANWLKVTFVKASSRTSPITVRSLTSVALMASSTSQTCPGNVVLTQARL